MSSGALDRALVVSLALLGAGSAAQATEEPSATNAIRFKTYVGNDQGVVRCGIFTEKGWLKEPVQPALAQIHGKVALCVFSELAKGVYGISAFHDENKNGKLDTNLVGYPTEEYCASRNARNTFSAPSFADAKFKFTGGHARARGAHEMSGARCARVGRGGLYRVTIKRVRGLTRQALDGPRVFRCQSLSAAPDR